MGRYNRQRMRESRSPHFIFTIKYINRKVYKPIVIKYNMTTRCPACGSTSIYEDLEKLVCRRCNYIHKTNKLIEKEKEVKNE